MSPNADERNRSVYHAPGIDRHYRQVILTRAEAVALLKHQQAFADRDVLDLGVGTGRTSIYLAPLARRYEAVDYSPEMVRTLQELMPSLSVHLGDIRDLSEFPDQSFDFVLGACNVIDAVGHEDRRRAIGEVARVLRQGGVFMFSSHNRDFIHALRAPQLEASRNPVTMLVNVLHWVRQLLNHAHMKPLREVHRDYALLDDSGHDNALLHYYVRQAYERQQLADLGFQTIEVLDLTGQPVERKEPAGNDYSLLYVARKI